MLTLTRVEMPSEFAEWFVFLIQNTFFFFFFFLLTEDALLAIDRCQKLFWIVGPLSSLPLFWVFIHPWVILKQIKPSVYRCSLFLFFKMLTASNSLYRYPIFQTLVGIASVEDGTSGCTLENREMCFLWLFCLLCF